MRKIQRIENREVPDLEKMKTTAIAVSFILLIFLQQFFCDAKKNSRKYIAKISRACGEKYCPRLISGWGCSYFKKERKRCRICIRTKLCYWSRNPYLPFIYKLRFEGVQN
ncbi:uncharacterized protein LOC120331519 [Styela clava]